MAIPRWRYLPGTLWRLGPRNVLRIAFYRALLKAGRYRRTLPLSPFGDAAGLRRLKAHARVIAVPAPANAALVTRASHLLEGKAQLFGVHTCTIQVPPDWFTNPLTGARHGHTAAHWSLIPDFDPAIGDIKTVWEMSRFGWVLLFAQAWRLSGEHRYIEALSQWLADWAASNPPNSGPNWKCAQEASIRLINLLLATQLLELDAAPEALQTLVELHCSRIAATTLYAVAQDNNHGTSEAAGLFMGGLWLADCAPPGSGRERGLRWAAHGRRMLEERIARLVMEDGSFSQHSVTYHRVLLDTLSVAESWRRRRGAAPFSARLLTRADAATRWLGALINAETGDAPNLGSNDGALPFDLAGAAYRDFRPCLQLASTLFCAGPALPPGPWDEAGAWLGLTAPVAEPWIGRRASQVFRQGGYVTLRNSGDVQATVVIRAPQARFRPPDADALHLDLSRGACNLLRDGGTYSYADTSGVADALRGVSGHNTVQFDQRDQMPRLGRFLYARWIRVNGDARIEARGDEQSWSGAYTDFAGCSHRRTVSLGPTALRVEDRIGGFHDSAKLRWRLAPAQWHLQGGACVSELGRIEISADVDLRRIELVAGDESLHYLQRTPIQVLEIEVARSPATLISSFIF